MKLLGHDRGKYYYLPDGSVQIVALRCAAHTKQGLLNVAPLSFWSEKFGCDWKAAQDALLRAQHKMGIFDPSKWAHLNGWTMCASCGEFVRYKTKSAFCSTRCRDRVARSRRKSKIV